MAIEPNPPRARQGRTTEPTGRYFTQIAPCSSGLAALANDGTVWLLQFDLTWKAAGDVPQPEG
jgi:hypothetical protein